jgi:hypothetical protein
VAADRRTDQGQGADPPAVGEREIQRCLPAHAQPDQRGLVQTEVVKDGAQVLDIVEWPVRQAGAPQTAGVVADDVVVAGQLRNDRVPQAGIHARAVQQDDRAAGAAAFDPQPAAARGGNIDFDRAEGVRPVGIRSHGAIIPERSTRIPLEVGFGPAEGDRRGALTARQRFRWLGVVS